jgi:hypothetical protein
MSQQLISRFFEAPSQEGVPFAKKRALQARILKQRDSLRGSNQLVVDTDDDDDERDESTATASTSVVKKVEKLPEQELVELEKQVSAKVRTCGWRVCVGVCAFTDVFNSWKSWKTQSTNCSCC